MKKVLFKPTHWVVLLGALFAFVTCIVSCGIDLGGSDVQENVEENMPPQDRPSMDDRLGYALSNQKIKKIVVGQRGDEPESYDVAQQLNTNEVLVIYAKTNPSSGYQWEVAGYDESILKAFQMPQSDALEPCPAPGASVFARFVFTGIAKGQSEIMLSYQRPWMKEKGEAKKLSIKVESRGKYLGTFDFTRSGPKAEEYLTKDFEAVVLPSKFDWRDAGIITPVKDQGTCGSCWAFGATAGFEAKIMKKDGLERDLAEQYLVSCNDWGMSCASGGWWAHDLWMDTVPPGETGAGAVLEKDYPYEGLDTDCKSPNNHYQQLEGWAYTDDVEDDRWPKKLHMPSVQQLKQKLYDWGPIPTALCTDNWGAYKGGVLGDSTCTTTTHIVLITGWDDGNQCWIIKNSWGADWGENGYIRIKYGSHLVGENSTYLKYDKTNPRLVYKGIEFWESLENNGKIRMPLYAELFDAGKGFEVFNADMKPGIHYNISGLPSGLSAVVTGVKSNLARITLTGSASQHAKNNGAKITVNFLNAAFRDFNASDVENSTYALDIIFMDPYKIVYEDIPDETVTTSNTWEFFELQNGQPYGLWYSYYDFEDQPGTMTFFLETYGKKALCTTPGIDIAKDRKIRALSQGAVIDGAENYMVTGGSYGEQHKITCAAYPDWNGRTAYAGIAFNQYGGTCYGWLRLQVDSIGSSVTVLDYAYNEKPYAPISAGTTTEPVLKPIADFACGETEIYTGQGVPLFDKSGRVPTQWSWKFPGGTPSSSSERNPTVVYNSPGTYDMSLTVSNSKGSDTITRNSYITVYQASPPKAAFVADSSTIPVGATVRFSDLSTNNPDTWLWSFPGGSPSSSIDEFGKSTYKQAGSYDVSLEVSNSFGSDKATKNGYIQALIPPGGYCSASYDENYDWFVARVQLNPMDCASARGANGYQDNTTCFASLNPGQQYTVKISTNADHWDGISIGVWVDWNQDRDFDDGGEQIMKTNQEKVYEKTFTVPSSAAPGMTRMRTRIYLGKEVGSPCGVESYIGEAEDHSIVVTGGGPTPTPTPGPDPDSCVGYCGKKAPGGCWCDAQCESYGDCCKDKKAVCDDPQPTPTPTPGPTPTPTPGPTPTPTPGPTPTPTPGPTPTPTPTPDDSCVGRCGKQAPSGCWCDDLCDQYGDCCEDKQQVC